MGDDDYRINIRNYYLPPFVNVLNNKYSEFMSCNNGYPDGKANRREARRRELRKRKGRL
jgi:hypothetical protein